MIKPLAKAVCLSLVLAASARAERIGDITRLSGDRTNVITGLGLVYGLKGTGDGGDYLPAIRMLASALAKFDNTVGVVDLKASKNVAVVQITTTIPSTGAHDGDKLPVYVHSFGAASSLKGGSLFVTPMMFYGKNTKTLWGFSNGVINIEDPSTPTTGVITDGCVIEGDFPTGAIENNILKLVIQAPFASWTTASNISKIINDSEDGENWAWATGENEVTVRIPPSEQQHLDAFISRVQRLPVPDVNVEARVLINERNGTLIFTGDVEISPVVITHKGLTISTILPAPAPSPANPIVKTTDVVGLDTTKAGGAKLENLISALDQLKVPIQDRIDIIKELYKTGKLHAKLITE